jgi:hypothetical protein
VEFAFYSAAANASRALRLALGGSDRQNRLHSQDLKDPAFLQEIGIIFETLNKGFCI